LCRIMFIILFFTNKILLPSQSIMICDIQHAYTILIRKFTKKQGCM
jgi:hypothetical protein